MWEAYELHCIGNGHDKFYRIIRSGQVVVIRYGRRGTDGQRQVKTFGANGLEWVGAEWFVRDTLDTKRRLKGYQVVYVDRRDRGTKAPTQEDEMERDYLERFEQATLRV